MTKVGPLLALLLLHAAEARAQNGWHDEVRVGSERELYLRVLHLATRASRIAWDIRPVAPGNQLPPSLSWHPWRATTRDTAFGHFRLLRPASVVSLNQSYPWLSEGAATWQGRGLNAAATFGVAASYWRMTARLEPLISYATNASFELDNPAAGFRDPMRPGSIDAPQRFGASSVRAIDLGESFVRADFRGFAAGLSSERIFWGPGVRHAILFSARAPGFPHLFIGTTQPLSTLVGRVHGQLVYGRLEESKWSPSAPTSRRFGSGFVSSWEPRTLPMTLGIARFYHRAWPRAFNARDLLRPFGSIFYDPQVFAGDVPDNQLATGFFSLRLSHARLELFGEFARNDRSVDARDLALEPEHNSAWLVGFLKAFAVDSATRSFWSLRYEAASGRVSAIQSIPRPQSTFFEHSPITQGHTHRGLLLGTPLIDRSGGSELALDHWSTAGRLGFSLLQRQMPPDLQVGMPSSSARTQWDAKLTGLRFVGTSELSYQIGHVWDLNRFPNRDVGNLYIAVAWRQGFGRNLQ